MKGWLMNGLLLAASLVVTLAVAEVAIRVIAPQPTGLSHQDRFGLAMHYPGITRYLPQFGHEVTLNSAGMRDREHTLAKPAGTFRVLLLGDSFMEALQVPFDSSFPAVLQRELTARSGRTVEVVNAGVGGWGTDDELRYLTSYGLAYQPDLVVVAMTLHNDISDNLRRQWHTIRDGTLVAQPVAPMSFLQYKIVQIKAYIATRFQLYQLWRRVRHGKEMAQIGQALNGHVVQLFHEPSPAPIAEGMALTARMLAAVRDSSAAHGARVALVLLPLRYQLSDSTFAAFVQKSGVPPQEMVPDQPQRLVRHVADSLGLPTVDLLPAFRQWTATNPASLYVEWDGHWNDNGHRLAGTAAAPELAPLVTAAR